MKSIVVRDADGGVRVLPSEPFKYEEVLQNRIAEIPKLIPLSEVTEEDVRHATIGHEWPAGTGKADVVLLGSDGVLTIVETKLKKNSESRREVIAQILEYAAYLSEWTARDVEKHTHGFLKTPYAAREFANKTLDDVIKILLEETDQTTESLKTSIEQNLRDGRLRLIIAVDEVGEQAQKIITFVNSYSSFDIYLLQISSHPDVDGREIFVPTLHGYARKIPGGRERLPWSYERYRAELGWTDDDVQLAERLLRRLEVAAGTSESDRRYFRGWVGVRYGPGRTKFGIQRLNQNMEIWFYRQSGADEAWPEGVTAVQRNDYLHFNGALDNMTDEDLRRLATETISSSDHDAGT